MLCFVFTDIDGSTQLWAEHPHSMAEATAQLDRLVAETVGRYAGEVVKDRGEGDSHFVVFASPTSAVHACADLVAAAEIEGWPGDTVLRVRVGVHVGEADARDGDYYGLAVNQTTRIRGLGHGGQVLASQTVVEMTEHLLRDDLGFRSQGTHRVRDFARRQEIFQLVGAELPDSFPRLKTAELDSVPLGAIVIIDIVGSSGIVAGTRSDEALLRSTERWQQIVSTAFERRHGVWFRSVGDGCVATFRDPREAVEFARAVREALAVHGLGVRAGIHFGPIEVVGDDISGRSVYLAVELQRIATPGQILISPAARDLLDAAGFQTEPAGTYSIPKFGLSWDAAEA
jgi:class 3 adenylate cyclase